VYKPFLDLLLEKTKALKIGDPVAKDVFLGPLINAAAVKKYERAVQMGKDEGRIVYGGRMLKTGEFARGYFVEPAIVDKLPKRSRVFQQEFFAPVLAVAEVKSLDEALKLCNASEYGLTAGLFTADEVEQQKFFEDIEAGVTYCNRRGGATTGAWPGVQSFGGWKCSGSSGKAALGPYYVAQFMREQSQTIVKR
jgi:1-pyrroline-5-carboxylate dehydrogenase